MTLRFDKLGVVIAAIAAYAAFAAPFATFRANRIVPGQARSILDALPATTGPLLLAIVIVAALIALLRTPLALRLAASVVALVALALLIGVAGTFLTPAGNTFARISPASGFWILIFAFTLLLADVLNRLNLPPSARVGVLVVAALAIGLLLMSGRWDSLSILKEYSNRADSFWAEGSKHLTLALGSLLAAVIVGLPLGILCHRVESLRAGVLNVLNIIQTIPSIALFGLLIAPLGWVATHVPGAAALGIRGIGTAPAFVALFLYSLLPVVANTVVGLAGVPRAANDAARGMGMTDRQRLFGVEFPLAFPVILTGIRIVLVQNIGLATIAALIGGGGFGVFVFQGVGQTAMDLVLLGAVPTVALAFAAAIILDAVIEMTATKRRVETA
ncbi:MULTISPECIES: ABC transporter permease [unclassified Mesorhizobium]|uniref:ABC transporter permease n=1 Tax=unclassified Mesorhizobium TaxID=325217 RepID=UPI000FDB947A|nr:MULTISPECIES: ABC transporter permease [unclassified Mesorhizobium]TGR58450.1 ABC transporter permease [bacterium M00.F.Ca.ET.199.01.1.1]TGU41439.1 ABC transporter permease [bacterium M00.F.Ca.ET.156.01.1.1]TGV90312.1 ABC transporter permease [Mesorhizobium sp. M00.F.Ca.ET.149.01.1.1]TGQ83633.1 ABC transporter permease [Mesorhizobium sp. M8A.F.Ca.ET.207.01.1.1]TGR33196.1 ABC transporter permease [Mesorhizobium sp. M8A.F.Ca.ET.197.01.1.1]